MARSNFDHALARLLAHEGGFSDHPSDPGGPTKYGITLAEYRRHVKRDAGADDIRAMNIDVAKTIYRTKYWDALRCDEMPSGVDYALFDYGVNSGVSRAAKVLQRLLARSRLSAAIDDDTLALARARDPRRLISELSDERLAFLRSLRTWPVFGRGWERRVREVRAAAWALAAGTAPPLQPNAPTPVPAKGAIPPDDGLRLGTSSVIVATGGAAAQQAHQAGASSWVVLCLFVGALVAAAIVWAAWTWWKRRRQEQPSR